jgi:hypothetical protein
MKTEAKTGTEKLLEVKKQIGTLTKNSKNPFFKSQYLDLNSILEEVEPILQENGVLLLQPLFDGNVYTQLIHALGGKIIAESYLEIPKNITDPQKIGACITYFRRYTLKSLLGIAEEDDDGNKASKPEKPTVTKESIDKAVKMGLSLEGIKKHYKVNTEMKAYFELSVKK